MVGRVSDVAGSSDASASWSRRLVGWRRSHPAWLLLAATKGPLMLAAMKAVFDAHPEGVDLDAAAEVLADRFRDHRDDATLEIGDDPVREARRELRAWISRKLIVERGGRVIATDALQRCFAFVESLEDQPMTSTASRLATVQRAIESLHSRLSSDRGDREAMLRQRIERLEDEWRAVRDGEFDVLEGPRAREEIREVYQLAVSLRADFRRVEDSFRAADRELRGRILGRDASRGQVVDELLDGHDRLLETQEGQVFDAFYQQLVRHAELELMKERLRAILDNPDAEAALARRQRVDLRQLVSQLIEESRRVIEARAQGERDVRGFLKSGMADENLRVGALLQEIMRVAIDVDWTRQAVRRTPGPLPPAGVAIGNVPSPERLRVKDVDGGGTPDLDLTAEPGDVTNLDEEFWEAYRALDRGELFRRTLETLRREGRAMTIGELAGAMPPTHDLESLAYWLTIARAAGGECGAEEEAVDVDSSPEDAPEVTTRFVVPRLSMDADAVGVLDPESIE